LTAVRPSRPRLGIAGRVLALAILALPAAAQDLGAKVKSAYLYHLVKFVEWPELPPDAVHLCVLGDPDIGALLGELSGRPVKNRSLNIEVDPAGDPAGCQLLFIGSARADARSLLERVRDAPVLTVGDQPGFAGGGGIVGFYREAGRIKLEIDPEAARRAGLRISGKLMELARPVVPH